MLNRLKSLFSPQKPESQSLHFKDNASAFQFASATLPYRLKAGAAIPALVLDSAKEFGTPTPVAVSPEGIQTAALKVSSAEGDFLVFAQTANPGGPKLAPGDLVIWLAGEQSKDLLPRVEDQRTAWVGLIVALLAPEFNPKTGWRILSHYRR